mmetsp:Transcript_18633/g.37609  ORF Transcript_18633/g.37609 Transcript_18633/m.37609 type:complete len:282 (+) Transcript_18633:944-1789(+)
MPLVVPSDPNDNTISPEVFPFDKRFPGGSARNLLTNFQFSHACSIGSGSFFVFSHSATSSTPSSSSMAPSPPSLSLPSLLLLSVLSSSNPFLFRSSFAKRSFLASALAFSAALNVSIPVINPRSGLARRRRASLHFKKASGAGSLYSMPNLAARAFALARSFSYSANNSASVATDPPPPPPPLPLLLVTFSISKMLTNADCASIGTPSNPNRPGIDMTTTFLTLKSLAFLFNAEFPTPTYLTASTPDLNILYILSSKDPITFFPTHLPTPALRVPFCKHIQ